MFVGFFVAFVPAAPLFVRHGERSAQAGDPARAVSRARRRDRALLGRRDPRLVQGSRHVVAGGQVSSTEALRQPISRPWTVRLRPRVWSGRSTPRCSRLLRKAAAEAIGDVDEPSTRDRGCGRQPSTTRSHGVMPSVFVLEHGRLWLVAQRGYAVVPDGITVEHGITGRAIRLGRPQLAPDVTADPDYVAALPGVVSELAVPLRSEAQGRRRSQRRVRAGASGRKLPKRSGRWRVRSPRSPTSSGRAGRSISPPWHVCSSTSAAFEIPWTSRPSALRRSRRCCPCRRARSWSGTNSALLVSSPSGTPTGPRSRRSPRRRLESARTQTDPSVVCHVLDLETRERQASCDPSSGCRSARTPGSIGALVGITRAAARVDPDCPRHGGRPRCACRRLARRRVPLQRERLSAATDPLTGILNRRGSRSGSSSRCSTRRSGASAQPSRHRLRRLQGDQRPRGSRVRRRASPRGRGRPRCVRCRTGRRQRASEATSSS